MNKIKSLFSFFLISFLVLASFLWVIVKAQEPLNLTIKPDGSVEPSTDLFERNGTTYTFKGDILGTIMVQKGSITIDGAGFTLGQGGITLAGPDLSHRACRYVLVKNLKFFNSTVFTVGASNNSFIGNYFDKGGMHIQGNANITGDLIKYNTFRESSIFVDYNQGGLDIITENNFINSTIAVGLSVSPRIEKNYWSNYNGTDTNGDGIGDTLYISQILDEPVQDNFPLMDKIETPIIPPKENLSNDDPLVALSSTIAGFISSPSGILLLIIALVSVGLIAFLVIIAKRKRNSAEATK